MGLGTTETGASTASPTRATGLNGYAVTYRFASAADYQTMSEAAQHLGINQATLVTRSTDSNATSAAFCSNAPNADGP